MKKKYIEILISPDGHSTAIEAFGYTGDICDKVTKEIVNALGSDTESKKKKEYFDKNEDEKHVTKY